MKRRTFLAGGAAILSSGTPSEGQQPGRTYRVGLLAIGSKDASTPLIIAFEDGLKASGFFEGANLRIEHRWADGDADRVPALAADLVRLRVDAIFAPATYVATVAHRATRETPIVFAVVADPIGAGLVATLARPGGNVTGLSNVASDLSAKRIELLKAALPNLRYVGLLWGADPARLRAPIRDTESAAVRLGLRLEVVEVRTPKEIEEAVVAMKSRGVGGIVAAADSLFYRYRRELTESIARQRLPAVFGSRDFVDSGGLMAYGANLAENWRRAGGYVAKILLGAVPADLPVEEPTTFEFVINLKVARGLGLTIPQSLLLRADQVIE